MNNAIEKELSKSGVLLLKLNRPEVLNAMNRDLIVGLLETFNETVDDEAVRAIVLTGNGRGFCAGADLVDGGWPNEENLSAGQAAGKNMETDANQFQKLSKEKGFFEKYKQNQQNLNLFSALI